MTTETVTATEPTTKVNVANEVISGIISGITKKRKFTELDPKEKISYFLEEVRKSKSSKYTFKSGFMVEKGLLEMILFNIKESVNTMIYGETGVGKTELIANIADYLGCPITIFDMGTMVDPVLGLIGSHTISVEDGKAVSKFKPSRFSQMIQQEGIVLLDEINRANLASMNLLFPCLDFRRELPMEYSFDDSKPLKVHPRCVFIATANVGNEYSGTSKIDKALTDRFMPITIEELEQDSLVALFKALHGDKFPDETYSLVIELYSSIKKSHSEFTIDFRLSIRHLKMIFNMLASDFTIYDSFYSICTGMKPESGKAFIKTLLQSKSVDKHEKVAKKVTKPKVPASRGSVVGSGTSSSPLTV